MQNTDPAIEEREIARDAARYRFLRSKDLDTINRGGVFAGKTPHNIVLNGDDLDVVVDAEMEQLGKLVIDDLKSVAKYRLRPAAQCIPI